MTPPQPTTDPWDAVARECPRRILAGLHASGVYHHGTSSQFPGKILCFYHTTTLPPGFRPTEAQALAEEADQS